MTKEECIKVLRALWNMKNEDCGYSEYEIRESLDMAIKILGKEFYDITQEEAKYFADEMKKVRVQSQEYCEDCVSRKSVLNQIFYSTDNSGDVVLGSNLRKRIEELPLVTATQKWIPCSERLPKEGGDYLVSTSFDIGTDDSVREVYKDFFCILSQKWLNHDNDVIAWQPLPPSYQGE